MTDNNTESLPIKNTAAHMRKEYIKTIADKIEALVVHDNFAPSDIMVLVQRRNPFVSPLVNELKSRGVDVAGSDRIILPEYPAIRDLLNLLRFCIDQTDDYSLACVLKSPFFRLEEADILNICTVKNTTKKNDVLSDNSIEKITLFDVLKNTRPETYSELFEIIELSQTFAPYSFFMHILNFYNYRNKMIAALGTQIIDPLEEFLTICLAYERTQPGTLRNFLKWFVTSGSEIKRDMDASTGVRIVTIHGSKGLEAPIVFLIDTTRTPKDKPEKIIPIGSIMLKTSDPQSKYTNDDYDKLIAWLWAPKKTNSEKLAKASDAVMDVKISEYYRLLYVAMTRARDRLYIYGFITNKNPPELAWHTQLMNIMPKMPGIIQNEKILRVIND